VRAEAIPEALDADERTLHVRCGSDIRQMLWHAGFVGDFYEHSYPYLIGPVREGPGCLEQRARFLAESYGDDLHLSYERMLQGLRDAEDRLVESASFPRVVIWSEADCYDQLVLARLLAHYATHDRPPTLELINVADYPGIERFIGLGQLQPEALRALWPTRKPAGQAELETGLTVWRALISPDPRGLAAIMRSGTPALPLMAKALHRHLRELPAVGNGLALTERMALELLARQECSLQHVFVELNQRIDPLPGQGDLQVRDRVLAMERATEPLIRRRPGSDRNGRSLPPWTDVLTITDTGRAVLNGSIDYRSLAPPSRWVGGVEIGSGSPDWRWDDLKHDAVLVS